MAIMRAVKTKPALQKVKSSISEILRGIETRDEWGWAKLLGFTKPLKEAQDALIENTSDFANDFMLKEVAEVKKTKTEATIIIECTNMVCVLDPLIAVAEKEVKVLLGQHKVKQEVA